MSGIVGIWNLDGQPLQEGLLSRLSSTLAHRGPDGEGQWTQGPVGLACQLFRVTPQSVAETQPLISSSGAVLVFDGRLDNRDDLLASLKLSVGEAADYPDSALVLAAYDAFSERLPEYLNGDFALGIYDPRRRQLLLVRDAIGVRPLYYCRVRNTFLFGSEIKSLLAHPEVSARPNDHMLAAVLVGGRAQYCHGMTFFDSVSSVIPGHVVIVSQEGFVTRRYWDFDPTRRIRLGSLEEYAETFGHLFKQAVRRRLRSAYPVAVSVSGGLDSSSIFCVAETLRRLHEPRRLPTVLGISYTYPDGVPSDEKGFLLEIERQHTTSIERVTTGPPGFMDRCREEVWHVEAPFLDSQWNTTSTFLRSVRQRGSRVLLTGHWGDQMLFDQAYLVDLFRRLAWREVMAHLKEFRRWMPDVDPKSFRRLFCRDLIRSHVPNVLIPSLRRLKASVIRGTARGKWYTKTFLERGYPDASRLSSAHGCSATAHFRSIYQEARSPYHVLCMEWNSKVASMYGMEMAFPFLDRDLLSFLMGIPGEAQTWQGTHKALLRNAMQGVLPSAIVERRGKADFTDLSNEGVERDYSQLADCLQSGGMAVQLGYVDGDALREEAARLRSQIRGPNCLVSWSFRDLMALELWLQTFFDSKERENEVNEYENAN